MPRYVACADPVPASDFSCASPVWVDQGGIADMLPTIEQANVVGFAFFASLFTVVAVKRFLKPQK